MKPNPFNQRMRLRNNFKSKKSCQLPTTHETGRRGDPMTDENPFQDCIIYTEFASVFVCSRQFRLHFIFQPVQVDKNVYTRSAVLAVANWLQ